MIIACFAGPLGHRLIITCRVFHRSFCLLLQSFPVICAALALACGSFAFSCHGHSSTYIFPTVLETCKGPYLESKYLCRDVVHSVDHMLGVAVEPSYPGAKNFTSRFKSSVLYLLRYLYVPILTSGESLECSLLVLL